MKGHPNATVAGGATSLGLILVYAAGRLGLDLSAEEGALTAGALASAALFIGRKGLRGVVRLLWRGQ